MPKPKRTFVDLSRLDRASRREIQIAMWKEQRARQWRREGLAARIANRHNELTAIERGEGIDVFYDIKSHKVGGRVKIVNSIIVEATPYLKYMIGKPLGLLLINCNNMKWTCTEAKVKELYEE